MSSELAAPKIHPIKDTATVDPTGALLRKLPAGVKIRQSVTLPDERGTVTEVYSEGWGFSNEPIPYIYQVSIRPWQIKGWVVHRLQSDRIFHSRGATKWVLYDDRPESPTHKLVSELYITEENRALMQIPPGVYHAVQNVGTEDAYFINCPTLAYNHENPDKYRLPLKNDLIPYTFKTKFG